MCNALVGPVLPGKSPLSLLGERLITRAPSCGDGRRTARDTVQHIDADAGEYIRILPVDLLTLALYLKHAFGSPC